MSSDGASMGVGAKRALGTILGGDGQPVEGERETRAQMSARLRSATLTPDSYDGAATAYARIVLEAYEKYPQLRYLPVEGEYLKGADGKMVWFKGRESQSVKVALSLHDVLKQIHAGDTVREAVFSGLTGFMVGWGVNAARYCLDLDPQPNPALVMIG